MKIAKDTFKEIIGIIKLCCRNASCSFIHCMAENVSSINEQEKKKNLFLSQSTSRNTGGVTSEYGLNLSIVVGDLGKTWSAVKRVIFWMATIKIHFV